MVERRDQVLRTFFDFTRVADHWQYAATIAIAVPIAAGIAQWRRRAIPSGRAAISIATAFVLILFAVACFRRASLFSDELTLWQSTTQSSPHSSSAFFNLAFVYQQRNQIDDAAANYLRATELRVSELSFRDEESGRLWKELCGKQVDLIPLRTSTPDSRLTCASHDEPPKVGDSTYAETMC